MGWIGCVRCEKFRHNFVARTFALVRPFCTEFHKATKRSQMHPNSTKQTKGLFGYDYKLFFRRENARSEKIPPNAFRYGRLSTSRLQLAGRVCTENQDSEIAATISILCIAARPSRGFLVSEDKQALKHQFRVQWRGPGTFVAKNSDATSWHELLH